MYNQTTNPSKKFDINQLVNNGWFILCCNICSIISLIITFTSQNLIFQIILAIFAATNISLMAFYLFYRIFNIKRAKRNIYKTHLATNKRTFMYLHVFYQDLLMFLSMVLSMLVLKRT